MSKSKKKPILSDHKKIGNAFVPPLLQITDIKEVSWLDGALPELIWLGLLNEEYGLEKGSKLALALAERTRKIAHREGNPLYALISSYASLSEEMWLEIAVQLEQDAILKEIRDGLFSLVTLYPECPFMFLFEKNTIHTDIDFDQRHSLIERFKEFLQGFLPKHEKPATMAQANAVYIAFISGKLKAVKGTGFDEFPQVANFPDTEASRRVAASIYPLTNSLMGIGIDQTSPSSWSQYFWNRGLEIERCSMSQVANYYEW